MLYGCDGRILYALSLADGSYKWKFDIDKDGKAGKITGDKAWAVKMEKSTFYGVTSNTVTTTWSDPRRILRPEYRGSHFIVFGEKQIIRVNKDGKLSWAYKWKYDPNQANLLFDPAFFGSTDNIVYACKGFVGLDGETGKALWEDKDVKGGIHQSSGRSTCSSSQGLGEGVFAEIALPGDAVHSVLRTQRNPIKLPVIVGSFLMR